MAIVRPEPGSPESLAKHNDWLYGDQPETCRCDHAWKPLGRPTPCQNYTARSWSPGSEQPEDARCVTCDKVHGPAVGGSESRVAPGQPADGERSAPPTDSAPDNGRIGEGDRG